MSALGLAAVGCAVGAAWVTAAGGPAVSRRLLFHPPSAGVRRELLRHPWPLPVLAALVGLLLLGPVAAAMCGGVAMVGRRAVAGIRAAAERERDAAAAATVCAVLAAELRAGRPAEAALALAAADLPPALAGPLHRAVVSAQLGGDVPTALRSTGRSQPPHGPPLLRQLATCWEVAGRTGAGLAGVVDALATDLRAGERLRLEMSAALAGPRTTAWLLAALPVVGIAMAAGFGAAPLTVLLRTPVGLGCLVTGTTLDLLGVAWTRRLVRQALDPRR